uniref:Uncharacterized protein n=1 Tax=Pygocentrus nattereri TaxID=42514 RepID=A0AAR2KSY1_PYGNA
MFILQETDLQYCKLILGLGSSSGRALAGCHRKNSCNRVLTVSGHSIITMWLPSSMTFRKPRSRICGEGNVTIMDTSFTFSNRDLNATLYQLQLFWEGFPQGLGVCLWEFLTILPEAHL